MRRLLWQAIWFYRRKLRGARAIDGLVLDVGSGNSPFPRADVLAEKYLRDDSNRFGGESALIAAPVVACDAEALPFADGAFDYVVCSHLIEHVDHPDLVLRELARVGRAGYLECPDEDYDKLDTPPYHRWFVTLDDGVLVMRQKESATFDPGVRELVHETMYRDSGFWTTFWRHLDRFFVMLPWQGEIAFEVNYLPLPDGSPGGAGRSTFDDPEWVEEHGFNVPADDPFDAGRGPGARGPGAALKRALWRLLRRIARPSRAELDVLDLVVCPADRSVLDRSGGGLACTECGVEYPVIDGVPHLYLA